MKKRNPLTAAFDPDVLKIAAPAYGVPAAGWVAAAAGVGVLSGTWPFLLAAAAGLHALLAVGAASRADADGEDSEWEDERPPSFVEQWEALKEGFARVKSAEGRAAVHELSRAYSLLQPLLRRRKVTDSLAVGQIPALAGETYQQGLSVLQDALELIDATGASDRQRLEEENDRIAQEIRALRTDPSQAGRLRVREQRLASNREMLDIMNQQQARIDELLYQADRCRASLHRTRMELAAMRASDSEEGVNAVVETLRLTISHAKGVQDEMRRLGTQPSR